ncbi:hypothetical protein EYZ11_011873 [Aspergillus tanneri]|uniref:Uncharacterized protein n=1 Tax=Aspergillus tanneri TaxID=1220188 RepID=A0A4S3J1R2_9EURO|nr:hypothetical protein EYZ11_011873 [Aspergillus tanneri]
MLNENIDCNQAMQIGFYLAQETARSFYEVVDNLQQTAKGRAQNVSNIFIEACRNVAMGLTYWSYSGERYFKNSEVNKENMVRFRL